MSDHDQSNLDPVPLKHRSLERIAISALYAGKILMETGAKAEVVNRGTAMVTAGLGAECLSIRVGYASLSITVRDGVHTITRMMQIGTLGVNLQLNHAARALCVKASHGKMTPQEVESEIQDLRISTPKHPWYVVALATGLACASFGQLLGSDALAFLPIWFAGALGQTIRHFMAKHQQNMYASCAIVAFCSSLVGAILALLVGSLTPQTAMFSSVLLLVPGVPATNAQTDIMEGWPTLGSARAVSVTMILVFLTVGVAFSRWIIFPGAHIETLCHNSLLHHTVFGAIAAAGFGILFNFRWKTVIWATLGGAMALSVRTLGMDHGLSLAMASTIAAIIVTISVRLLYLLPISLSTGGSILAVAGCIPMIPGSAAAHGIIGLLSTTAQAPENVAIVMTSSAAAVLSAVFTIGGIGAGITIVNTIAKRPSFPQS